MLELLEDYLRVSGTPESIDNARRACDHLDSFELSEWDVELTDLLMRLDDVPLDEDLDQINGLLCQLLKKIIVNFRIQVSDDITLLQFNDLLDLIRQIEETEETDAIISILDTNREPIDAFCQILAHFSGDCADNYYPIIFSVAPEFTHRIRELLTKQSTFEEPGQALDVNLDRQLVQQLKQFCSFCRRDGLLVMSLIRDGAPLGQPFQRYFNQLIGFINEQKYQESAQEFIAMAAISAERGKLRDVIVEALNRQYSDATTVTRLMMSVEEQLLLWNNHNKAGVQKDVT